jgi:hypothetical protein
VHWLESVSHIRQSAPDDYGHRVIKIRTPHLVFDVYMIAFRSGFHPLAFPVQSARRGLCFIYICLSAPDKIPAAQGDFIVLLLHFSFRVLS